MKAATDTKGAWQDTSPGSFYAPHPLISMHLVDID